MSDDYIPDSELALLCDTVHTAIELARSGFWGTGYWLILTELECVEDAEAGIGASWGVDLIGHWRVAALEFVRLYARTERPESPRLPPGEATVQNAPEPVFPEPDLW